MIRGLALAALGGCCREALSYAVIATALAAVAVTNLSADPALEPLQYGSDSGVLGNGESDSSTARTDPDPVQVLMQSIVSIEVEALDNARTADTFGVTRTGSGVVIDTAGLIATAGDIVAEAAQITITFSNGEVSSADLVAYDHHTGLGLVRAQTVLPTVAISLGESAAVEVDDFGMIVPSSGKQGAVAVKVGKIDAYSGGWEYIIDNALHTYPPSTNFNGAPLVSESGELLGVGMLVSIDIDIDPKIRVPGNVFIPVDSLTEVLGKLLLNGRSDSPQRQPWIGLDIKQSKQGIVVSAVAPEGPAESAGIRAGDLLVALNKKKIEGQSRFFQQLWKLHKPGDQVEIMVLRGAEFHTLVLTASDYYDWLRLPPSSTRLSELDD